MKNYVEENTILKYMIILVSITMSIVFFLPIYSGLEAGLGTIMLVILNIVVIFYISFYIKEHVNNYIDKLIEKRRVQHIKDFFSYLSDNPLYSEELRRDTPIINDKGDEIGSQTIYGIFSKITHEYLRKLD